MSKCFGAYRKYRSKREFGVEKTKENQKEADRQKNDSFFITFVTPEQYVEDKIGIGGNIDVEVRNVE